MVGGYLWKMWKIFFSLFKLRKRRNIAKRIVKKSSFTFYNKEKKIILNLIKPLTALIKIHRQLSHVMQIGVWYFICAHELFSIWLFHRKLAFVLVKFSLWQDKNRLRELLAHFRLWIGENLVEPAGSASNKIFGSWATVGRIVLN